MPYSTYQELNDAVMAHYPKGEFSQALEILNAAVGQFPEHRTDADYLRSCLAVRVNELPLAYQILDALYADRIWISETIFRDSPSYAPLQGQPEFEQRVRAHAELRARMGASTPAQLDVLPPAKESVPTPTIFHLHGNGSHPSVELPNWQFAANKGWLVAAPTAQDVFWAGGNAVWPSHASAETQIAGHFSTLQKDYAIDPTQIILTGFSMGGDVAMAQTLTGNLIPARGFIAVAPGGPMVDDPESYLPLIEGARGRGLRGVIMASSGDPAIDLEKIARLAQFLNEGEIPCRLVFYSDEGHTYPEDFPKRLKSALAFIFRNK
ncbi:MAG TPA: hypothetical protein PK530_06370 [Anaerolineales bacterium]|nr:hypothetical protein [Anaerolineales bacterium]